MRRSGRSTPGRVFHRFMVMILLPAFIVTGTMGAGCDIKGFKAGSAEGIATGLTTLFSGVVGAEDPEDAYPQGATELFAGLVGGFLTGFWSDDVSEFEEDGSQK